MEIEFIRALRNRLPPSPHLAIGPGDDAAVLREDGAVVTCDMLCEGTHFSLANDAPAAVGRKAMAVNLSDLAADGCETGRRVSRRCVAEASSRSRRSIARGNAAAGRAIRCGRCRRRYQRLGWPAGGERDAHWALS